MKKTRLSVVNSDQQYMLTFYETYSTFLFHCAWKYTDSKHDCEDIIQDTVLRLMRNIGTLRTLSEKQIFTYLNLTVRSVYADRAKSRTEQEIPMDDEALARMGASQSMDGWADVKWDVEILRSRLSGKDWRLLELKYILGCSDEEISRELGCQRDSVRMLLKRARQRAKILLSEEEGKDGATV